MLKCNVGLLPETLILFFLNQINNRERDLSPNFATPFLPNSVSGTEKTFFLIIISGGRRRECSFYIQVKIECSWLLCWMMMMMMIFHSFVSLTYFKNRSFSLE